MQLDSILMNSMIRCFFFKTCLGIDGLKIEIEANRLDVFFLCAKDTMLGGWQGIAIQLLMCSECSLFCYVFGKVFWVAAWGFCKLKTKKKN